MKLKTLICSSLSIFLIVISIIGSICLSPIPVSNIDLDYRELNTACSTSTAAEESKSILPIEEPTIIISSEPDEITVSDSTTTTETTEVPTTTEETKEPKKKYFETNLVYTTTYTYTSPEHPQSDGKYWYDAGAYAPLISLDDNSRKDGDYIVHSIASDPSVLPAGSIIYIEELDKYFRVDDNNGTKRGKENPMTRKAWDQGTSFWIDIYVGQSGIEGPGGIIIYDNEKLSEDMQLYKKIKSKTDILTFTLIRYGRTE